MTVRKQTTRQLVVKDAAKEIYGEINMRQLYSRHNEQIAHAAIEHVQDRKNGIQFPAYKTMSDAALDRLIRDVLIAAYNRRKTTVIEVVDNRLTIEVDNSDD